jgi:hypothetical protein
MLQGSSRLDGNHVPACGRPQGLHAALRTNLSFLDWHGVGGVSQNLLPNCRYLPLLIPPPQPLSRRHVLLAFSSHPRKEGFLVLVQASCTPEGVL